MLCDLQQCVSPYGFWIGRCSHVHLHGELLHWKTKRDILSFCPLRGTGDIHPPKSSRYCSWPLTSELPPMKRVQWTHVFLNLLVASYWPDERCEISSISLPFLQRFLAMLVRIRCTLWGVSLPQRQTPALLPCPHLGELWLNSPSENSKEEPPPCFGSFFEAEARRSF